MNSDKWAVISKIKRGKNRKRIFLSIDGPIMPSELVDKIYGKNLGTYFTLVSRALNELVKLGLVKIQNPKEKTGRIYTLTKKGNIIKKELMKSFK